MQGIPCTCDAVAMATRIVFPQANEVEIAPSDCADAYDLATNQSGDTMGILFDWERPESRHEGRRLSPDG